MDIVVTFTTAAPVQIVFDKAIPPVNAAGILYDNLVSGLTAIDVQAAIDELAAADASPINAIDIIYDNTTSGLTAIDVQTAIDELAASGGGSISNSYCEIELSTNQTIPPSANTKLNFNNVIVDILGDWNTGLSRFTPTIPIGETYYYLIVYRHGYTVTFVSTDVLFSQIYKNSIFAYQTQVIGNNEVTHSVIAPLTNGEYLEFFTRQNTGASKTVQSSFHTSLVQIVRLSKKDPL